MGKRANYEIFVIGFILLSVIVLLYFPLERLNFKGSLNYNEGWNAYHTSSILSGQPLYAQNKLTPVNYPPVSFYFVAAVSRVAGNPLVVGRILALLSMLLIAAIVGYLTFMLNRNMLDGFLVGALCFFYFHAVAPSYIGMNDPQFLGELFMVIGLFLYYRYLKTNEKIIIVFIIPALFLLGLFTKHNLLALPLSIGTHLFLYRRNIFKRFFIVFVAGATIISVFLQFTSNNLFIPSILIQREYSLRNLLLNSAYIFLVLGIPFLLCLLLLNTTIRNKKINFLYFYLFFSLISGIIMSGGIGVTTNIFFDFVISLSLCIEISLARLRATEKSIPFYVMISSYLFLCGFVLSINGIKTSYAVNLQQAERLEQEKSAIIQSYHGPALCFDIMPCYFAGKSFSFDPVLVQEMILTGRLDKEKVLTKIASGYYKVIEWNSYSFYGTPAMQALGREYQRVIDRHYHLIKSFNEEKIYLYNQYK